MAYDRYDEDGRWRGERGEPSRHRDERHRSEWRGEVDRGGGRGEERGFFERASDEISSWFGGDDRNSGHGRHPDEHRREMHRHERDQERGYGRERSDDRRSSAPMHWALSTRDYREDQGRGMERSRGYQPMAGDYGRHGDYGSDERGDPGRGSEWQRDPYRSTSFAGSAVQSNRQDPPYDEWRRRHMDELDRDYHDYRGERQEHFEQDFGSWRDRRESKRSLLGRIREHMDVVGSDGEHVGTVDRVAGDRIILTKSDPESGGVHHSIPCTMVDDVDENRVTLDLKAERAKERWRDENRERALFEREDQGRAGPGMLNRSFSGTYR